jgi:Ca2+-binding EF-hand superfamily protein
MKRHLTPLLAVVLLVSSCASTRNYESFSDWDSDKSGRVERREFVEAYLGNGYFKKWHDGKSAITYAELFDSMFKSIDSDKDNKLSIVEFNSQIRFFYFGLFNESFSKWDTNSDASINLSEFSKGVSSTNLASIWDTDDDKRIMEREMAGGMFYICDADSNGSVDETELNTWKRNR